ncbi:sensor histidine kinase [Paenibacillus sp. SC116]|uniref:sensor histidine kinase n=1 Tax=Paenibacillus sp. SC116 TaxID=2968986 RepID=UPI00215A5C1C|nr:sensor histidine kinase [Paenibacillus sp. SC116]MCR8844698.1 sensor histidine kinase [Paenibacillus sp. SC116]
MLKRIYQTHFKRRLFNKLIVVYSCIALISLVTLSLFTYQFFVRKDMSSMLLEQQRSVDAMNRYFDQKYETSQLLLQQLYQDNVLIRDTVYFLENGYESYLRYRLDTYSESNSFFVRDFHTFYANQFWKDSDLKNIVLVSPRQGFAFMYSDNGVFRKVYPWEVTPDPQFLRDRYPQQGNESKISDVDEAQDAAMDIDNSTPSQHSEEAKEQVPLETDKEPSALPYFTVTNRINNPDTLTTSGEIMIDFGIDGIRHRMVDAQQLDSVIVLNEQDQVIYFNNKEMASAYESNRAELLAMKRNQPLKLNLDGIGEAYVTLSQTNKLGMTVISMLPSHEVTDRLAGVRTTIGVVTVLCVILVVVIAYVTVIRISRRTQVIVKAMKQVPAGKLDTRINFQQEDELSDIAHSFNHMVNDLSDYINRVYKSELKQKHAELVALQSQIKPHFLYNTLEVIRMRAVAKGAHDVGDMIYNLASIFRHMVKDKTHITLQEEIENCKRYLELTRIRYRDKLQYTIDMDVGIGGYQVMKLSVQPMIENYLVHGLGLERTDNHIWIHALREEDELIIRIRDNGSGILPERLQQLQEELNSDDLQDHGSLGIKNVHNRLRILYGDRAGIELDSIYQEGTTVTIRIPIG